MRMMIASLMVGIPLNILSMENDRYALSWQNSGSSYSVPSLPQVMRDQFSGSSSNDMNKLFDIALEKEKHEPDETNNFVIPLDELSSVELENSEGLFLSNLRSYHNVFVYVDPISNTVVRCWGMDGRERHAALEVGDRNIFFENSADVNSQLLRVVHNKILYAPRNQQPRLWDLEGNSIPTEDYKFARLYGREVPFEGAGGLDIKNFRVEGKYIIYLDPSIRHLITHCWNLKGIKQRLRKFKENFKSYLVSYQGKTICLEDSASLQPGSFFRIPGTCPREGLIIHIALTGERRVWSMEGRRSRIIPDTSKNCSLELLDYSEAQLVFNLES